MPVARQGWTPAAERRAAYLNKIPKEIPEGRVLAHNTAQHHAETKPDTDGFRCWTWRADDVLHRYIPCSCGWSGLPHVALR